MDCEIRIAPHDHRFHLAHKKPLAAHLGQRTILDAVALGPNVDFLDDDFGEVALYLCADPARLDESKIARACCDAQFHFDLPVDPVVAVAKWVTLVSAPASVEGSFSAGLSSDSAKSRRTASIRSGPSGSPAPALSWVIGW